MAGAKPRPWNRIVAEFLVIFVGVTLSLAADDWRQGQEDRVREEAALRSIAVDLVEDSVELADMLMSMARWDTASVWFNRHVDRASVPSDSLLGNLRQLSLIRFYQPVSSSYVGLRDAGRLYLIESGALRRDIVDYYEVQQPYMAQFFAVAHERWRLWFDVSNPSMDWVLPDSATSMWSALGNPQLSASWREIAGDEDLHGHIDFAGMLAGNLIGRLTPVLETNSALRRRILAELEDR